MKRNSSRRSILAATLLALLTSTLALAQEARGPNVDQDASTVRSTAAKSLVVSGKVSDDARTLFTDLDSEWTISNPEMLKGREGSMVTLKCRLDTSRSEIQIISVKPAKTELKYVSRAGDAAFRR